MRELWPNFGARRLARRPRDPDGDGFVEYQQRSPTGLQNQGWKDSQDSIVHADGSLACGPIALCEVQAYVYAAKLGLARSLRQLGDGREAEGLEEAAKQLRVRFLEAFWCPDLGTYALALDGAKRPCQVRASNAGHALFAGIASRDHAALVAETLLSDDLFSGWGVRTLGASCARFNPMSYHNGSVWPHDNALLAHGLARYGATAAVNRILSAAFDASRHFDDARIPELLCGFTRVPGEAPTAYPVACSPQAWSAEAYSCCCSRCSGRSTRASGRSCLARPALPSFVDWLVIRELSVGGDSIDLLCEREGDHVDLRVLRQTGDLELVVSVSS
jgi:glycogen debranching enzyme